MKKPHAARVSVLCAQLLLVGTLASCEKVNVPSKDDQATRAKGDTIRQGGTTISVKMGSTEWEKDTVIHF